MSAFVIVTGAEGFIGRAVVKRLSTAFPVVAVDQTLRNTHAAGIRALAVDITSDESVRSGLEILQDLHGKKIASVIHLAAYFDLTGEPNPKYEEVTVRGTERLLRELRERFTVQQFVYISTMLVHKATTSGTRIDESREFDPKIPYRASKIETEALLRAQHGDVPLVILRPAGIYDDQADNPFIAHQIARIYEKGIKGHLYAGPLETGQSFLHLEDLVDAIGRVVERRAALPVESAILLGEPKAVSYGSLQHEIGCLIHGEDWKTFRIAEPIAKAGAWAEDALLDGDPFIKPWMVESANEHYELDISAAKALLSWKPKHQLRKSLAKMVASLKADPVAWYQANKLEAAVVSGRNVAPAVSSHDETVSEDANPEQEAAMQKHMAAMESTRLQMLWVHWIVIALGTWLATSPFQLALFDPITLVMARDITVERGLWEPATRNELTGWSDVISGGLLVLFGSLSLSRRMSWAQWGTGVVGLWLLFAPLVFWTPSAAAYLNDTLVGTFAIVLSLLVVMMPGMSHEGMMDESTIPAGWTYSPSDWLQRLPMIVLGFVGFLIARYLAAYQFGHIDHVWEPLFGGPSVRNGTEHIITSHVSTAWPVADAGLGASTYMIETLMGAMGGANRWRTMPWMVTFFFILVVPLGAVSIFFIIIQPIVLGTYCTLCIIAAAAMLIMIPFAMDEVIATGQYLGQCRRAGRPLLRTFFQGGPSPEAVMGAGTGFDASPSAQWKAAVGGTTWPWTLVTSCAIGVVLMFSRPLFGTSGALANSDHLIGALVITVAVIALAEVARTLRFVNLAFGCWLVAAPWILNGTTAAGTVLDLVAGVALIGLSLPRGTRSHEHYGSWDRYVL